MGRVWSTLSSSPRAIAGKRLFSLELQVAWRISTLVQDANNGNAIISETKINVVPFNTATTVAAPDVSTCWRAFWGLSQVGECRR